jgi:hypothetical protein
MITIKNKSNNRQNLLRIVVCVFMAVLLLVLSGCDNRSPKIHKLMSDYLRDRYGMEFVVGQLRARGDVPSTGCAAKAYPKDQLHLEFTVHYQNNCYQGEITRDELRDNFLSIRWSYQGKLEIEKKIREVYGDSAQFVVNYDIGGGDYKDRDLDYWQMMEQIHGTRGIMDELYYTVFVDGAKFNKEEEAKKAHQILKTFVLDYRFTDTRFRVIYIDKADKQDYLSNTKPYIDQFVRNSNEQHGSDYANPPTNPKKIVGCFMFVDPIYHKIKSHKDIVKYSKYNN